MYRILLADDEPLVLAGVKNMLDWQAEDCELIGTARNGKQAMEAIEKLNPDIVIADIKMPVLGGIELLKYGSEAFPDVVFIMLTNYQDFELARHSLRFHAVDYLVKAQLDTDILTESLKKAKEESDKRRNNSDSRLNYESKTLSENQFLAGVLKLLIAMPHINQDAERALFNAGVLDGFIFILVQFICPEHLSERNDDAKGFDELFKWQRVVIDELAGNCFSKSVSIGLNTKTQQVVILIWGSESEKLAEQLHNFNKKLTAVSADITGLIPCLAVSDLLSGKDSLPAVRKQLFMMRDYFYLTGARLIRFSEIPAIQYKTLGLNGIEVSLKKELSLKNAAKCAMILENIISRIREVPHEKSHALWLLSELYTTVCNVLSEDALAKEGIFADANIGYSEIESIATRDDAITFLTAISNELVAILQPLDSRHSETIERVKQYIFDHIDKKITLHEAASHVFLSAGYLSSIFKKNCGESFIDFVNRHKIEKACELLRQEHQPIGYISDILSFENTYYFAKIFKRYTGMTPRDYRKMHH